MSPSTAPHTPAPLAPTRSTSRFLASGDRCELDRAALARAQAGDRRAQRALIDRYQRPVAALITRMLRGLGGRALVEDLVQETFLRVLRGLGGFDLESPTRPSSWILTIARRRTIDELRRRRLVLDDRADLTPATSMAGALSQAERGLVARHLAEAITRLRPEQREVFVLRELDELTYEEIAARLGINVGTVKSRLSRARSGLREILEAGERGERGARASAGRLAL